MEKAYLEIVKRYEGKKIIITGFSIGSGLASWLASRHKVNMLILIAPLYNLAELSNRYFPFLPSFILRYPLKNNTYLQNLDFPVILIHGSRDEIIPFESSHKLKEVLKPDDKIFIMDGLGHNSISGSSAFQKVISEVLSEQ